MNSIVTSYATDPAHSGLARLAASLDRNGWRSHVVNETWRGYGGRLKSVLAGGLDATHLVHVDAYDVVALGRSEELEAALAHYGNPALLVAAEGGCWPDGGRATDYPARKQLWWYAHSQFVLDLTQPRPAGFGEVADTEDDQRHLHDIVLAKTPGVVLDLECRVFQSIAFCHPWTSYFEMADGRIVNKITGSKPLFAHGNGQTDMSWIR